MSKINQQPVPMKELVEDEDAVVEGEVLSTEVKLLKENKYTILLFNLTDLTSSIQCKKFFRATSRRRLGRSKGQNYRVRDNYAFDTYAKSFIFNVTDMAPVEKKKVMDTSERKRVELHLHTNMSAQGRHYAGGGLCAPGGGMGHKAIAITDHGVVQAFPEAANAAKKCGIKVVYGMEAYMVDDRKKGL